jgi:Zn-dependent peptidase ImmA (M78 family)/transcriptional regulator with XRE-family HTH domain
MAQGERINPAILVWARESAGLDLKEAAHRIGLTPSENASSEGKLLELEGGRRLPSRTQLTNIAKTYRRPLLAFYMPSPPPKGDRGNDFRFTAGTVTDRDNALLDALLRDVRARQEMLKSLLEDEEETTTKPFVGSCSVTDDKSKVAERIASALELPADGTDRGGGPDDLFRKLRSRTEALGVFVLLVGDLGSYHSALSEEVFRGFALADDKVPFIVINDHDARTARSFTLIHELTHIYLGQTGVSGSPESVRSNTQTGKIEEFCNDVAGLVLLPASFARQRPTNLGQDDDLGAVKFIQDVAKKWSVSEPLVAFRLRRLGWISSRVYQDLCARYSQRWQAQKANEKAANQMKEGGPSYYVVRQYRLGDALMDVVRRTIRENRLTHTKAAKILGVKPGTVEQLIRHFEKGAASFPHGVAR